MINIGFISLDILILVILFCALFFHGIKTGKKLLLSLIISIYPSLLIFSNFPYMNFEAGMPEAISFLVIYVITVSILMKIIGVKKVHTTFRKVTDYSALSITYLVLLLSVSSSYVTSLQNLYSFSGVIPDFVNKLDFGLLLIIPIAVILLTSKSDKY